MNKKTNTNKKRFSKSAIAFYIAAAITFIVFIYTIYNVQVYLNTLLDAGQITWAGNWADILNYYITNGFNYLVFTGVLVGVGYVISLLKKLNNPLTTETVEVFPKTLEEVSNEQPVETITEVKVEEEAA